MRILTIVRNLERGGTQRAAQNFAISYSRLGHESEVLAMECGGIRAAALKARGITVSIADSSPEICKRIVANFSPDLIHIHRYGSEDEFETRVLEKVRPLGAKVMETNVFGRPDYGPGSQFIDVHFQLSRWCMWKWRKDLGRAGHDTPGVVVPNPVDITAFARAPVEEIDRYREHLNIPRDAYVCGRVGQPLLAKWHPSILWSFAEFARKVRNSYLLLVGVPEALKHLVIGLDSYVRERIRIVPPMDNDRELALIYSSMNCFVHASRMGESFGYVLTEAMLCGCPVVTVSTPDRDNSQLEIVGHREGGICVASFEHLNCGVEEVHRGAMFQDGKGDAIAERVRRQFDSDTVASLSVKVGELTLETRNREQLYTRLQREQGLCTKVSDGEKKELLGRTIGNHKVTALARMHVVHIPAIQRMLRKYRKWQGA